MGSENLRGKVKSFGKEMKRSQLALTSLLSSTADTAPRNQKYWGQG